MKKTIMLASGVVLLVALLAGAAFVGTRMLVAPDETAATTGGRGKVIEIVNDDGSGPVSLRIIVEPAPELPDRPAEASGIFVRRQDNSIFVGTGSIELDVEVETGSDPVINLSSDGPEIEVVVTRDTVIYSDETDIHGGELSSRESGEKTIQQVIKPVDSLDEIGPNTELQVWGERRGDRLVAEVLVYRVVDIPF
jgi:hypothetical protein